MNNFSLSSISKSSIYTICIFTVMIMTASCGHRDALSPTDKTAIVRFSADFMTALAMGDKNAINRMTDVKTGERLSFRANPDGYVKRWKQRLALDKQHIPIATSTMTVGENYSWKLTRSILEFTYNMQVPTDASTANVAVVEFKFYPQRKPAVFVVQKVSGKWYMVCLPGLTTEISKYETFSDVMFNKKELDIEL